MHQEWEKWYEEKKQKEEAEKATKEKKASSAASPEKVSTLETNDVKWYMISFYGVACIVSFYFASAMWYFKN